MLEIWFPTPTLQKETQKHSVIFTRENMDCVIFWHANATHVYVGYHTDKFMLPVTPLTVPVQEFFAFIIGDVIFYR